MRKSIAVIAGVLMLAAVNLNIWQREQLLTDGRVVLLELAPVDPRSLMQGDYMALRFQVANDAFVQGDMRNQKDGHIVVKVDERGVGQFKRFADASPLAADEVLMRYRIRNNQPKFATNAFFFQEGTAQKFEVAKYGEFRVAKNGDMILTAMRDEALRTIGGGR